MLDSIFFQNDHVCATIVRGEELLIGWSAPKGDRGPGATHETEMVAAITADELILVGGKYKNGAKFRTLKLVTSKGKPTSQIRAILR